MRNLSRRWYFRGSRIQHGGTHRDTRQMLFSVPAQKLEKLMHSLNAFHTRRFATPKEISRIADQIISMGIAIGPLTRLFTRHIYQFIESRLRGHSGKRLAKTRIGSSSFGTIIYTYETDLA